MTNELFSSIAPVPVAVLRAHFESQYAAVTGNALPDFLDNQEVFAAFGEVVEQKRGIPSTPSIADMVAEYNLLTGKNIKKFASRAAGEKQLASARKMKLIVEEVKAIQDASNVVGTSGAGQALSDEIDEANHGEASQESNERSINADLAAKRHIAKELGMDKAYDKLLAKLHDNGKGAKAKPFRALAARFADKGAQGVADLLIEAANMIEPPKVSGVSKTPKAEGKLNADRSAAIANSWNDPTTAAKRAQRTHVVVNGTEHKSVREAFVVLDLPLSKHIKFRIELKAAGSLVFKHEGREFLFTTISA